MTTDAELLRQYAATRDEAAFAELVRRHVNLVYRAALRQLGGDVHRAADATQLVFTLLAQKGSALTRHPSLAGWLFTTTHFTVRGLRREERRRQTRETEALIMQENAKDEAQAAEWARLRPVLDDALQQLGERDREALLARFFEERTFGEIGTRLVLSEDAARMRVERAMEKLRALFARRGVTSTGAALGLLLANEAACAAPVGLAASVTGTALAATAAGVATGPLVGLLQFMSTSKITAGIAGMALVLALTVGTVGWQTRARHAAEQAAEATRQETDALAAKLRAVQDRVAAAQKAGPAPVATELPRPPVAPAAGGAGATPNRAAGLELMRRHPEVRHVASEYMRSLAAGTYAPLFTTLRLSPEQIERFLDLALQGSAGSVMTPDGPIPFAFEGDRAEAARELRELLGEDGYAQYRNFDGMVHQTTTQLAAALYRTVTPLTAAQSEQMQRVFMENKRPTSWSNRARFDWPAIMASAEGFLSGQQLVELDYLRARDEVDQAMLQNRATATAATK